MKSAPYIVLNKNPPENSHNQKEGHAMKKAFAIAGAGLLSVGVPVLAISSPVFGWNPPTVAGVVSCITNQNGGITSWKVDWTATNHENHADTTAITNPVGYSPSQYLDSIAGQTFTRTQVLSIGTASASEQVTQKWFSDTNVVDDTRLSNTATVYRPETCIPPVVVPGTPTATKAVACGQTDTYTIPSTVGVVYSVNGTPTAAGTYPLGNGVIVVITFNAVSGYVLNSEYGSISFTGGTPVPCPTVITPVAPTLLTTVACGVNDTFTVPAVDGIVYSTVAGTYELGAGVSATVSVVAGAGHVIATDATTSWTFVGSVVEACAVGVAPTPPADTPLVATALPRTGVPSKSIAGLAAALVLLGSGVMFTARRKPVRA